MSKPHKGVPTRNHEKADFSRVKVDWWVIADHVGTNAELLSIEMKSEFISSIDDAPASS